MGWLAAVGSALPVCVWQGSGAWGERRSEVEPAVLECLWFESLLKLWVWQEDEEAGRSRVGRQCRGAVRKRCRKPLVWTGDSLCHSLQGNTWPSLFYSRLFLSDQVHSCLCPKLLKRVNSHTWNIGFWFYSNMSLSLPLLLQ